MFLVYLVLNLVLILIAASESIQDKSVQVGGRNNKDGNQDVKTYLYRNNHNPNVTYFDKEDNLLRVPNKFYDNHKKKPKAVKAQKRTVQKIIKKGRNRSRKIYVNPMTRKPTIVTNARMEEWTKSIEDVPTTEVNHRKRLRKNPKLPRYPMPFHKFARKDSHRSKRDTERDVYILKDLDEIEFLSKENDYDIINAHIQKYW